MQYYFYWIFNICFNYSTNSRLVEKYTKFDQKSRFLKFSPVAGTVYCPQHIIIIFAWLLEMCSRYHFKNHKSSKFSPAAGTVLQYAIGIPQTYICPISGKGSPKMANPQNVIQKLCSFEMQYYYYWNAVLSSEMQPSGIHYIYLILKCNFTKCSSDLQPWIVL
jgi:hypothetical protein